VQKAKGKVQKAKVLRFKAAQNLRIDDSLQSRGTFAF